MSKRKICKNCGHRIRSTTVNDNEKLRGEANQFGHYTHSKHPNVDGVRCYCRVKECWCNKPEPQKVDKP